MTRLGDVADFVNGAAFRSDDWGDVGHPIIRIQNLTDPSRPFNRTVRKVSPRLHVLRGDLLVSWSATLGVFVWNKSEMGLLNQHIFKVEPDETRVDRVYLKHALEVAVASMRKHLHGATMKHINRQDFLNVQIHVPSIKEQRRIASLLEGVEHIKGRRMAAIDQLTFLRHGVMNEGIRSSSGVEYSRLGSHLEHLTSGSRGWAKYYSNTGRPFVRVQNLGSDELLLDDLAFVEPPANAEATRTRVAVGDVLVSITADLGRTAVVGASVAGGHVSQHLAILRSSTLNPRFLSAFICSAEGRSQLLRADRGASKSGLNFDNIRSILVPNVSRRIQDVIAERYEEIDAMAKLHEASLATINELFVAFRAQALRGEL